MKSTPAGLDSSLRIASRWSRLVIAFGAAVLGLNSAFAQTYGVSTYAGVAFSPGNVDTAVGPATAARFNTPKGVAVDSAGNVYVADAANGAVRRIAVTTGITTTLATGFSNPAGVAVDAAGANVYVADTGNHRIARITITSGVAGPATTIAGGSGVIGSTNDATGTNARFFNPSGIALNSGGTLAYVADTGNHLVRRIDLSGVFPVTTIAGTVGNPGADNGTPGTTAKFSSPFALAVNSGGTLVFVADRNNHAIRQIDVSTVNNAVTTFSGTAGTPGTTDSPALFRNPEGVAIDAGGVLYVADSGNSIIRRISTAGAVSTIAGTALTFGSADGLGTAARFQEPFGVVVHSSGVIYVSDASSQTIRRLALATAPTVTTPVMNPVSGTVTSGGTITFTTTFTGSPNPTFRWEVQGPAGGGFVALTISAPYSVSTSGNTSTLTISGATAALSGNQYRVVATNGVLPDATSGAVVITVSSPPVMANSTVSANFTVGTPGMFTFTATGSPAPTLSILSGNFPSTAQLTQSSTGSTTTGTISWTPTSSEASGSPYTFTVRASNSAGADATQSFTLNVLTGPVIVTHPSNQAITPGGTAQFTVGATSNSGAITYQWQRMQFGTGFFQNIFDNGIYLGSNTASLSVANVNQTMNGDQFKVTVTGTVGVPATSNVATLTVAQPPQILSVASASYTEGQPVFFQLQSTGSPTPTYSIVSGNLPAGLTLDPVTGTITGTPQVGASLASPYNLQIRASNGVFPEAFQSFILTISPTPILPSFTTHPQSVTIALGQPTTFTASATGSPLPTIQWERQPAGGFGFVPLTNDATFAGVNTNTLVISNPTTGMNGDVYRATAVNTTGSASSNTATLTINVGTAITTYAGQVGFAGGNDGIGTAARFNNPTGIATDFGGNVYVADSTNHVIRKISPGGVVTTLAGLPGFPGTADGNGSTARFNAPSAVAVNSIGTVYVADTFNHTIRVISSSGNVTTLAGSPGLSGSAEGQGVNARFSAPAGIATDQSGTVYVADTGNSTIRRISFDGTTTLLAGSPGQRAAADGFGTAARFASPTGLAIDAFSTLYVADVGNHAIRRVTSAGAVTTLAGVLGSPGNTDTPGLFNQPSGVAINNAGTVFVADTGNQIIRSISPGGVVTTLAGVAGAVGSIDGIGSAARFNQPYGIAVDLVGSIYVADKGNHAIRRTGSVTAPIISLQPVAVTSPVGGTASYSVTATGSPTPTIFQWSRQPAGLSGFVTLTNDGTYSGVNTATLTVSNITQQMSGDQFQVTVNNLISPNALSTPASLTVGTASIFTSPNVATFQATVPGTFTVAAQGSPTPTYSATGLPSWATINSSTGVISGTPPNTTGSPFTVTVSANNGIPVNQTLTITVLPAVIVPTIATQPASVAVDQGQAATFTVTAAGTGPFTYLWRRDGVEIVGATTPSLSISNAQLGNVGSYTVTVSNSVGLATSQPVTLAVNTAPTFTIQPQTQTALAGSTVTLQALAQGGGGILYQWRKNGLDIPGAVTPTLTLNGVSATDVGNYDVIAANGLGRIGSSMAQLNVATTASAPVISLQPARRTVLAGRSVTLSVSASGAPSPSYQWRKDGNPIAGANSATYTIANVQPGDAASYDVVVSNSAGSVGSAQAGLRVFLRSYAGTYFGSFGSGLGNWALYIREDNTGVFLGYMPGSTAPVMGHNLSVTEAGTFSFSQGAIAAAGGSTNSEGPARAAALNPVSVSGNIAVDGAVTGSISGGANTSLAGARIPDVGATQGVAGYYQAGSSTNGATAYTIAGANGQAFVVTQVGSFADGGTGTVTALGQVSVATPRAVISEIITPATGMLTGNVTGPGTATFSGASEAVNARQRLVNISSRARVATGDAVAIAGFVISGEASKPVLIRAVGPSLLAAPFSISTALASPRLELFRGETSLGSNSGIAGNRVNIDAAGAQAGAFPLGAAGTDAAILTTLAPGNYTAVVSSTTNTAGVALVEVYDLSGASPGQKLLNIATRAPVGAAENTLIAGFVIPAGANKRVLVRGVGPGLSAFGVTGVLAQPTLTLLSGSNVVATNTAHGNSLDSAAITAASAQVGAFGMAAQDSAIIATLAPGNYTAQVVGPGTATGVALIEVYELP